MFSCVAALSVQRPLSLDQVTVMGELGRGGFGAVHLVVLFQKQYALKVVPNRFGGNKPEPGPASLDSPHHDSAHRRRRRQDRPAGGRPEDSTGSLHHRSSSDVLGSLPDFDRRQPDGPLHHFNVPLAEDLVTEREILVKVSGKKFLPSLLFTAQTAGHFLFCLAYCPKGSLSDLLVSLPPHRRLGEPDAAFLLAELVCAIATLHRLCIVHKDIKCDNILVDGDGHIVLADFGLSVVLEPDEISVSRHRGGTAGFIAPEIFTGAFNECSDWFSVGRTAQSMLCDFGATRRFDETSGAFQDLVLALTSPDPRTRLGAVAVSDVRHHPFFVQINWRKAQTRRLRVPAVIADCTLPRRMGAGVSLREALGSLQKPVEVPSQLCSFSHYARVGRRHERSHP